MVCGHEASRNIQGELGAVGVDCFVVVTLRKPETPLSTPCNGVVSEIACSPKLKEFCELENPVRGFFLSPIDRPASRTDSKNSGPPPGKEFQWRS